MNWKQLADTCNLWDETSLCFKVSQAKQVGNHWCKQCASICMWNAICIMLMYSVRSPDEQRYESGVWSTGGKWKIWQKERSTDVNRGKGAEERGLREGVQVEEYWWGGGEQHCCEGKLSTKSGEADSDAWPHYSHSPSCSLSPSLSPFSSLSFCLSLSPH